MAFSEYPERFLRGISDPTWVMESNVISSAAFRFGLNAPRSDGLEELSINWYDDEDALNSLLYKQKENTNSIQFKGGVAVLSRQTLDRIVNNQVLKGCFSYERSPTQDNKYHGNMLCPTGLSRQKRTLISSAIAMSFIDIVRTSISECP